MAHTTLGSTRIPAPCLLLLAALLLGVANGDTLAGANDDGPVSAVAPADAPKRPADAGTLDQQSVDGTSADDDDGPASADPPTDASEHSADAGTLDQQAVDGTSADDDETAVFERMKVIGSPIEKTPGSVTYLGKQELRKQDHGDIHRVLKQVPGVNVQEEDGYGLRPNIGMRGTGVERSAKITVMEDGVLIAPAPYSAPSAYYFPTVARMEGIEVRKGSSSIQQGPYTNGGVLNMISSSIPTELTGEVNLALGNDETRRGRASIGGSSERFGWLVETFQMQTDGFKQLDGGGPTGFDLGDYMAKVRFNTGSQASRFQAFEIKIGLTRQDGQETYVGLTDADFDQTPFRRYAGSQEDQIDTDHKQLQMTYMIRMNRTLDITATAYRNDFYRNWHKLQSVSGTGIGSVLEAPQAHQRELTILRGEVDSAPGELAVRNNRRNYESQGIQTVFGLRPNGGFKAHQLEFGVRYHRDEEDRFQEEDLFQMVTGRMTPTSLGDPGSQSNRINSAEAWALFAVDTINLERWTITPGARFESIDYSRVDYGKNDPGRTGENETLKANGVNAIIPGVGATYAVNRSSSLFAGVHRGFSPPGPGATDDTLPEESINYELGYRFANGLWNTQLTGFYNDYSNLLGADTLASGGAGEGDMFNGGNAEVYGLEVSAGVDAGEAAQWSLSVPIALTYTYTHGEFLNTFESNYDAWGSVAAGDELPYLPENQAALSVGLVGRRWSTYFNLGYVDAMRTVAGQGPIPVQESTDAHALLDVSASYNFRKQLRVFALLRNATDEIYIAARRPAGVRPGIGRTLMLGISWDF
jgi:Fe(3+) dicitrate transport protein